MYYNLNPLEPSDAEALGYHDIASYISRFKKYEGLYEKLVIEICELNPQDQLDKIDIVSNKVSCTYDVKVYLPISKSDRSLLQPHSSQPCPPQHIIDDIEWYCTCIPQALGFFLQESAFRDAKPLHELTYSMSFSLEDYLPIGHH